MGIWDWLFGSSQKKKEEFYIHGIKIPEAYTSFLEWQKKNTGKNPLFIRYFEGKEKYPFVFDPDNAAYKTFSVRCLEDTKKLGKAIIQELEKRDLSLWPSAKKFPASKKKNFLRVSFLMRTPYFSSQEDKSERWEGQGISFILHFDQNHRFHLARTYIHESDNSNISLLKNGVAYILNTEKDMLTYSYGNWGEMARVLLNAVERKKEYLCYLRQM